MKKLNWLLMYVVVMISTVSLVSCSDDDEDLNGDPSKLYGMWEPVHAEGYDKGGDEEDSWNKDLNASNDFDEYYRVEILDGNTYKTYGYYSGSWHVQERGTFSLEGNKIYLDGDRDNPGTITSINDSQMVLESTEEETYGGIVYISYDKVTYRKVN